MTKRSEIINRICIEKHPDGSYSIEPENELMTRYELFIVAYRMVEEIPQDTLLHSVGKKVILYILTKFIKQR